MTSSYLTLRRSFLNGHPFRQGSCSSPLPVHMMPSTLQIRHLTFRLTLLDDTHPATMDGYGDWQDVLRHTDIETARLIVQLQLEDSYELARTFGGDPDAVLAETLHRQELRQLQADFPSRQRGEDLEEGDNDLEQVLEGAVSLPVPSCQDTSDHHQAFGWSLKEWEDRIVRVAEPPKHVACTACTERTHPNDIVKVPCGHDYCRDCLEQLYHRCMTDETLFPPRCCHQEFPYELVKHHLSQRCRSRFGQKRVELETKDRTYCHVPTCSAFIKPEEYEPRRRAQCNRCSSSTCASCKGPYHSTPWCPEDGATQALMGVAERNEWQTCFGCRRIVELKHGCNHIT